VREYVKLTFHPPCNWSWADNKQISFFRREFYTAGMAEKERARKLRQIETWAEKLMWRWLRDRRFSGYKFRRQHPLGDYYLDFFCEEAELNVELDGSQHGFPDQRKHDMEREKFLKSRGIKTLRFWNSHLRRNPQSIRDTIFEELQKRVPHALPEYTRPVNAKRGS
jgi:very-short-patch-repair endonuclease